MQLIQTLPLLKSAVDQVLEAKPPELATDQPYILWIVIGILVLVMLVSCFSGKKEDYDPEDGCLTQPFDEVVFNYKPEAFDEEVASISQPSQAKEKVAAKAVLVARPALSELMAEAD